MHELKNAFVERESGSEGMLGLVSVPSLSVLPLFVRPEGVVLTVD